MENLSLKLKEVPVSTRISHFNGKSGTVEYHIALYPTNIADIETQIGWLYKAYTKVMKLTGLDFNTSIFQRFFCSDLVNQADIIKKSPFFTDSLNNPSCISCICQPPGPYAKIALWAYHIKDRKKSQDKKKQDNSVILKRDKLTHYWTSGLTSPDKETPYEQALSILEKYNTFLNTNDMTLKDNVIRTWFFIQNIDVNYKGFVIARREFFERYGLTKDTHYISSTGVGGSSEDIPAKVIMDAYAISGIQQKQITYLSAPEHLSPTYVYGVTFERGTSISYNDRKHIIISGTASIDNKGHILYPGDVSKQLDRTLENIEALLKNAGASLKDMGIFIVYLRDPSDYSIIMKRMKQRFRNTPLIIAYAPVCRPGWLVEIEGIAIIPQSVPDMPPF